MIVEDDSEAKIDLDELIVVEDVMITLSKDGFIKRIPVKTYQRSNAKAEDKNIEKVMNLNSYLSLILQKIFCYLLIREICIRLRV